MMMQVLALSSDEARVVIPVVAIAGGLLVAIIAIITSALQKVAQTKAKEESRREIAAYVAEGTISPDDATKMLNAGSLAGHIDQFKQKMKL